MKNKSKKVYIILSIILALILILNLLVTIVLPPLIILEIFVGICEYFTIRKIKILNNEDLERQNKENNLLNKGYIKIYDELFLDEQNKKINIMNKDYNFAQIIDCELIENHSSLSLNNTLGTSKVKIKNNGKIKINSNTITNETKYCDELYINITTNDFHNPNIKFNLRESGILRVGTNEYKSILKSANDIISLLKLIIHKNKEKIEK